MARLATLKFPPSIQKPILRCFSILLVSVSLLFLAELTRQERQEVPVGSKTILRSLNWRYLFWTGISAVTLAMAVCLYKACNIECRNCAMPAIWRPWALHNFCVDCGAGNPLGLEIGEMKNEPSSGGGATFKAKDSDDAVDLPQDIRFHAIISGYSKDRRVLFLRRVYNLTGLIALLGMVLELAALWDIFAGANGPRSLDDSLFLIKYPLGLCLCGYAGIVECAKYPSMWRCGSCRVRRYSPFCAVCGPRSRSNAARKPINNDATMASQGEKVIQLLAV